MADGPAAYFTCLLIKAMLLDQQRSGIAAEVSQTAGTFVCDQVFYGLMHVLATHGALEGVRGGFVHLPMLPQQGTPCMAFADMVLGLRVAMRCALRTAQDVLAGAGSID